MDEEARNAGQVLGNALATLFVTRQIEASYSKLAGLARLFAKFSGYRTLDEGTEFMDGFIDAFFAAQPKQITEEKREK